MAICLTLGGRGVVRLGLAVTALLCFGGYLVSYLAVLYAGKLVLGFLMTLSLLGFFAVGPLSFDSLVHLARSVGCYSSGSDVCFCVAAGQFGKTSCL